MAGLSNNLGGGNFFELDYGHEFQVGSIRPGGAAWDPILSPEEAWSIDKKVDDGLPGKGYVIAAYWNNLCSAADNGTHAKDNLEASYKLNDDSIQCSIYFIKQF